MTLIRRPTPLGELISLRNTVARIENGLLRLSIPTVEVAKPRQIKISPVTENQPTAELAAEPDTEQDS